MIGPAYTNTPFPFGQSVVWQPDPLQVAQTNLAHFMARHGIADYFTLLRRAAGDVGWFWDAALADLGIEFYRPYTTVFDPTPGIAYPRWCVDGEMNIVHNCLDKWQATAVRDRPALVCEDETGQSLTLTYGELAAEVTRRGRELLQSLIEAFQKHGCTILEADTDGIYISSEKYFARPEELLAWVGKILPAGIELEHDGTYDAMFCYKAKNYAHN